MSTESNQTEGQIADRTREDKLRALAQKQKVSEKTRKLAQRALARRQGESS